MRKKSGSKEQVDLIFRCEFPRNLAWSDEARKDLEESVVAVRQILEAFGGDVSNAYAGNPKKGKPLLIRCHFRGSIALLETGRRWIHRNLEVLQEKLGQLPGSKKIYIEYSERVVPK